MAIPKIVFINRFFHPDDSATSLIASELAFDLAKNGMTIEAVTSGQRYNDARANLAAHEANQGIRIHRVWSTRFGRGPLLGRFIDYLTFYLSASIKLLQIAQKGDVLVAKTDPPLISVLVSFVARIKKCRTINWLQDLFPEIALSLGVRALEGPIGLFLTRLRDISVKSAAMNIAIDPAMEERVRARVPSVAIRVIPNWADGSLIRPIPPESNDLRGSWGFENKFVVGYCGNLGRAYDFTHFLKAAEQTKDDSIFTWLLIGSGAQNKSVLEYRESKGLSNLIIKPYQPHAELASVLSVPDIHFMALAPGMEGLMFPSKFYAILAAARPVVFVGSPNHPLYGEINESRCGFALSGSTDASTLVSRINDLRIDRGRLRELGLNARNLFESKYEKRIACESWRSAIRDVLGSSETCS